MLAKYTKNNTLKVVVKPNAQRTEVLGFDSEKDAVKIAVSAPAENNRANLELVRFVSKELKKQARILKGIRAKEKILKIT